MQRSRSAIQFGFAESTSKSSAGRCFQSAADHVDHGVGGERLAEVSERLVADRSDNIRRGVLSRHDDDGRGRRALLNALEQLQAIEPRHADVGQDEVVRSGFLQAGQPLEPVISCVKLPARLSYAGGEKRMDVGVVVDHQNPRASHSEQRLPRDTEACNLS